MDDNSRKSFSDPVIPNIEDWPIFHLSEDRRNFVKEIDEYTLERLLELPPHRVGDIISKVIYLERIRTKEEPWKVDPPKEKQYWKRMGKRFAHKSLDRSPEESQKSNREVLQRIIHRYSEEIVGTFRIKTFMFARRFLTFFFTRLLNAAALRSIRGLWGSKYRLTDKLNVEGELEAIRSLITKGTVVVVPTHFSNLDSILVGYAMDSFVGLPSFSYGAGLNLYNTGYTAYFMNRLGAYRVDRRKKNTIYLETLKAMSTLSIKRGVNSLFFPGGTRNRSGQLETRLKLGLLGTTVEAQRSIFQEGRSEKVYIVPLVLGYHFVLEAEFLIEQHLRRMGKEHYIKAKDEFYSPWSILKFAWKVFSQGNDITLSFGQPMDVLGNPVDKDGNSYDQTGTQVDVREYFLRDGEVNRDLQRESEYTQVLGERIVDRYHKDNLVLSSHLVAYAAFALLQYEHPRLDLYGILRLPPEDSSFLRSNLLEVIHHIQRILLNMEERGEIRLSEKVKISPERLLQHGLRHLGNFHIRKPLRAQEDGNVISESYKLLYYYHNRLSTYSIKQQLDWNAMALEEEELQLEQENA